MWEEFRRGRGRGLLEKENGDSFVPGKFSRKYVPEANCVCIALVSHVGG